MEDFCISHFSHVLIWVLETDGVKYKPWPERVRQRETRGSVSPAPQCSDEVQQVGADDSAVVRQEVSSTQHFKGNSPLKIIYSFGFSTRQHILLAYPARMSPGRETKRFSFSFL